MSNVGKHSEFRRGDRKPGARRLNDMLDSIRESDRLHSARQSQRERIPYLCQIVASGPGNQPDFCDARYWIRQVVIVATLEDSQCGQEFDYNAQWQNIDQTNHIAVWDVGLSLSEIGQNTHALLPGTFVHAFEVMDAHGRPFFAFTHGGGGGSTLQLEVRIDKAIAALGDAVGVREIDAFTLYGPHLKCYGINASGNFITEDYQGDIVNKYFVVYPNWMQPVANYKNPDGTQIYNSMSPTAPVFTAYLAARGWTLAFNEGEKLVTAPDQAAI